MCVHLASIVRRPALSPLGGGGCFSAVSAALCAGKQALGRSTTTCWPLSSTTSTCRPLSVVLAVKAEGGGGFQTGRLKGRVSDVFLQFSRR